MLNSLDDTLGFQPPPPIYSEIANISKCAQRMISKFFVLKLYISWGPRTPKKLEDLLQQGWRLVKSTVKGRNGAGCFMWGDMISSQNVISSQNLSFRIHISIKYSWEVFIVFNRAFCEIGEKRMKIIFPLSRQLDDIAGGSCDGGPYFGRPHPPVSRPSAQRRPTLRNPAAPAEAARGARLLHRDEVGVHFLGSAGVSRLSLGHVPRL